METARTHESAELARQSLARADGQPLAAFGAAALEHNAAVLRLHAHEETMCTPATAAVRLVSTFHLEGLPTGPFNALAKLRS